jgi:GT2 family glycosyltransferase
MTRSSISVVLPVYNEDENIAACLRGLWSALAAHDHEILVCYDFDEDKTLPAIAAMSDKPPSVRLVKNTLGRGAAFAIRAGFAAAEGDVVVTTMADLCDPPEVIPLMAEKIRAGADVVAGSRYMRGGSQSGGPLLKRTISRSVGWSMWWIAGLGTHDATTNFRAYSKKFLESIEVESKTSFDIALELTVKAHLAGAAIDEVPSSWIDRTAGESRFRMWKWMPNYLRWYVRAMIPPLAVGALFIAAWIPAWLRVQRMSDSPLESGAELAALTFACVFTLWLARRTRGRTTMIDALHVLLWMGPWQIFDLAPAVIAATATASAVVLGASCGWANVGRVLRRTARWWIDRIDQRTLGAVAIIVLMWLSHMTLPENTEPPNLDSSWHEVKAYELAHHWQAGVDTVFTYGPLGCFFVPPFVAGFFWFKAIAWEGVLKLVLAAFIVYSARKSGAFEMACFCIAFVFLYPGQDAFFFASIVAMSMCVLEDPHRLGAREMLALCCMSLLSAVKFTSFMLVGTCIVLLAVQRALAVSRRSAAGFLALYAAIFAATWTLCGQSLLNLPRYVQTSLWIARGYNDGMTGIGPRAEVVLAAIIMSILGAISLFQILQRPRDAKSWIGGAILCIGAFAALKGGMVRHSGNSCTFFGQVAISSFLLAPLAPITSINSGTSSAAVVRTLRALQTTGRVACAALGIYGCALAWRVGLDATPFVGVWQATLVDNSEKLTRLPLLKARLEHYRGVVERMHALPRICERVGSEPVDVFGYQQGMALLNGLNYKPRPVFQSYSAYTRELIELNAEYYSGERAPRFVMFAGNALDDRLPCMEDGLALQVLMRDYEPVLAEDELLLFERARDPHTTSASGRRTLLDTTIHFGDVIDLGGLPGTGLEAADFAADDGSEHRPPCLVVALEIHPTLLGRLRSFLMKGSKVFMSCTFANGASIVHRILPGAIETGALVSPYLATPDDWTRWFASKHVERIAKFSVNVHKDARRLFDPSMRLRVYRDDSLRPRSRSSMARELEYSMFSIAPEYARAAAPPQRVRRRDLQVLLAIPPSELCFPIAAGRHRIRARFGMMPEAFESNCSDGAGFSVVLRGPDGNESPLFRTRIDRGERSRNAPHPLDVAFECADSARILLRTDSNPSGDANCDWTYWTEVAITDEPITRSAR